jgi:tetratricopeptide (TPR) repeat protein
MKKLFFTAALACLVMSAFAQKKVLRNASKAFSKENYEEAKTLATEASNHPDTKDNPDVYMLLGKIELKKFEDSGKTDLVSAQSAYEYFAVTMEKGDEKLREEMTDPPVYLQGKQVGGSESMGLLERYMLEGGNAALDVEDFEKAYRFFVIATEINPSDLMYFFTGYAADNAELKDDMELYYTKIIESTADSLYENANYAYNGVIQYKLEKEQYDEALELIRKAQTVFPDTDLYMKWEVEVLISNNMIAEAVAGLKEAIASGNADVQTITQLSFLYWQAEDLENAVTVGKQAVAKDSENFDANYVLGGAIYDQASGILRSAQDPDLDDATYNKLKEDAKVKFKEALPYFEKCYQLKPDDEQLYPPMSTIYDQLGMDEKRDEMLDKMGN